MKKSIATAFCHRAVSAVSRESKETLESLFRASAAAASPATGADTFFVVFPIIVFLYFLFGILHEKAVLCTCKHIMVKDYQSRHGLYHRHRARYHTGIVASLGK